MMSLKGRLAWGLLTVLIAVVLWLCNVGRVYLYGIPSRVLESLTQGSGLVPAHQSADLTTLLAYSPWDPLWSVTLFCALTVLISFGILWWSLYKIWQNFLSPTLTCGALFMGAHTLWLTADTPTDCLGVAFKALGVACLVAGKVPLTLGPVLGTAYCDPAAGVALYLGLTYMAYKRHKAYGVAVAVCCVLGGGLLLAMFCADYTLEPALSGLGVWSALPLAALALNKELRASRAGLYLTLLLASVLTGSAELASAICLGDLALLALRTPTSSTASSHTAGEWRLPWRGAIQGTAIIVLLLNILPGEQYLNRQILIPAQEHDVPLHQLIVPFSLSNHAEQLKREPWRLQTPFPGLRPEDVELVETLQTPFRVLTLSTINEDRNLSLVYSLLSRQRLTGWDTPDHLSATSLVCKNEGKNVLVGSETLLFREPTSSRLESGTTLPDELGELAPVDLRRVLNIPFRAQQISEEPGTGYRLIVDESTETLFFADGPAQIMFSSTPITYKIESLSDQKEDWELEIAPLSLELVALDLTEVVPSRSLVPLEFKLFNRGRSPISTKELKSLTLGMQFNQPISPSEQPFPKSFVLYPQEGIDVELVLATPESEGRYQLVASYKTIDDESRPLTIMGDKIVNTWRRLPPVGTWIEEPQAP
jgi:hypothetical protein